MELAQFITESQKSDKTVMGWIKNGLVNGAAYVNGTYTISDLSRPPYMHASSRSAASIRKGIVVGCKRSLSVNCKVFKISEDEFNVYVDQLIAADLIEKRVIEGVAYYFSTMRADSMSEKQIYKLMKDFASTVTEAATGAITEQIMKRNL